LLIVARGGGSLEDLWSFNEEIVVRAAADSMIPLIAAVGHETDTTLIDFAADKRAPTPTGAAEMAVPVRLELLGQTRDLGRRVMQSAQRLLDRRKTELRAAYRALPSPDALVAIPRQRLDLASERLGRGLERNASRHRTRLTDLSRRLLKLSPQARLSGYRAHISGLQGRLGAARGAILRAEKQRLSREHEKLVELSARARKGLDRLVERKRTKLMGLTPLLKSLLSRRARARLCAGS
jgi:exodeoxyribonuclease VII large subunit